MHNVLVSFNSSKKNLDGKIYTQELVQFLIAKLKEQKYVFSSPTPGPKSFEKDVVGTIYGIHTDSKDNSVYAVVDFFPNYQHLKPEMCAIFFAARVVSSAFEIQEVIDIDDIDEPIFFFMLQSA